MNLPNIQIKKILYATDLSETAVHAFSYALSLAVVYNASITMLHVVSESSGEEFISSMISSKTLKEIKEQHHIRSPEKYDRKETGVWCHKGCTSGIFRRGNGSQ